MLGSRTITHQLKGQNVLTNFESIKEITLRLLAYCKENDWAGYDPYDALNSRVFKALPMLDIKLVRLVLTQLVKRAPINLRPPLLVPKTHNPKGLALFLSSLVKLSAMGIIDEQTTIVTLTEKLLALRSPGQQHSCWGYSFDWQTRSELVPKGSPNIICTTFVANALLDAYDWTRDPHLLDAAQSAADFILDVLFWRGHGTKACFSYTQLRRDEIHNANLLGAAFLCRVGQITGQKRFLEPALDATRYSASRQHADGAWYYGEETIQRWIDNFHTGYNLSALNRISRYMETREFDEIIRRGLDFYLDHFFRKDGAPKYFHDSTYPIDIHSVAQSIITLVELGSIMKKETLSAYSVFSWAVSNMLASSGYFYFQKRRAYTVRTSFMRWSQAWMLLALATLLNQASLLTYNKGSVLIENDIQTLSR